MKRTILIIAIVVVLLAATGIGAYAMGDNAGLQRANAVRQQFFQGRQTNGEQSQQGGTLGGGGNFAGRGMQGTIKSINGNTLVITLGTREVNVTLDGKTQVERTAPASQSDLAVNERVMVTTGQGGSSGADSIAATTLLIMPAQ